MNHLNLKYIAVVGFASQLTQYNISLAKEVGMLLTNRGFAVIAGNVTGTFHHVFKSVKKSGGHTRAIIESELQFAPHKYCDIFEVVNTSNAKHSKLAEICMGAIVIGGGHRSKHLLDQLSMYDKPIVAIKGSGGIVRKELDSNVHIASSAIRAVSLIECKLGASPYCYETLLSAKS